MAIIARPPAGEPRDGFPITLRRMSSSRALWASMSRSSSSNPSKELRSCSSSEDILSPTRTRFTKKSPHYTRTNQNAEPTAQSCCIAANNKTPLQLSRIKSNRIKSPTLENENEPPLPLAFLPRVLTRKKKNSNTPKPHQRERTSSESIDSLANR